MLKPIIIGNWKMYKNINETKDFILQVEQKMINHNIDAGIAVSFPLSETSIIREASKLIISAQNCHFENAGAFTGEFSPLLLKTMDFSCVVLGHSEGKSLFNEIDRIVNKKVLKVLENNF
ncbi:triose-phosphate isomerase [Spiroplasma endosymbiont of Agriotes lineatus]|uniref:triose-phosphate isomerase n=1 Tax=Spiroplasma endosymbiont of Agriotes lineatus TaxID=3077930 RepID=UPI0030CAC8D6